MDDLLQLKNEILDELITITDETGLDPAEKFELLMTRYTNTGDTGLLKKAHEVATSIEDTATKGSALVQLLEEIEIVRSEQSGATEASTAVSVAEADKEKQPQHEDKSKHHKKSDTNTSNGHTVKIPKH